MIQVKAKRRYLSKTAQKELMVKLEHPRHKLIMGLQLFAGLRVGEACSLKWTNIDFPAKKIVLQSAKKRGKPDIREIPIDSELDRMLRDFYKNSHGKSNWIFPSNQSKSGHIERGAVFKKMKKVLPEHSPHDLRHSAASNLAQHADLATLSNILGHKRAETTMIYLHSTDERKEDAVRKVRGFNLFRYVRDWIFPVPEVVVIPHNDSKYSVGRIDEIRELSELFDKRVNAVILGRAGTGRKHLLRMIEGENILRLDEIGTAKQTLGALLREVTERDPYNVALSLGLEIEGFEPDEIKQLHEDGLKLDYAPALLKKIHENSILKKFVMKENAASIADVLNRSCAKNEWTIIVEDVTDISPAKIKVIEKLKHNFHFIIAARQIKIRQAEFISNFQQIRLEGLKRAEAIELIERASSSYRKNIEDFEVFKNHIFEETRGLPKYIIELCERFGAERTVTIEKIRSISHATASPERDWAPIYLIIFLCFAGMKYYIRESSDIDKNAGMLIGTLIMIGLYFLRPVLMSMQRKHV